MKKDKLVYVEDIKGAIAKIKKYVKDMDAGIFERDEITQDAVIRNLAIIGEAANNLLSFEDHVFLQN